MAVKKNPQGHHPGAPRLFVEGAGNLIEFIKQAFAGKERFRMARPDGGIMHAEIMIGDSLVMLGDATEQWRPMAGIIYLYVEDADAAYRRALEAGADSIMEP